MSAAAPLPPPGIPTRAMNGYMNGGNSNGADGSRGSDGAGDSRDPGGSYPAIAEIVASASETVEALKNHSVCGKTWFWGSSGS
jgi:ubiquitin carboxyl-terminal hydrolase 8